MQPSIQKLFRASTLISPNGGSDTKKDGGEEGVGKTLCLS